jgi:hypothetical protein
MLYTALLIVRWLRGVSASDMYQFLGGEADDRMVWIVK